MQPIIYSALDANAPQLTKSAGTLRTILKACLVTGYGDKPAAGWEIAWEDSIANKMAIRSKNPTSIKSVLLVSDTQSTYTDVSAYRDWDAVNNVGIQNFKSGYFLKNNSTDTLDWLVFATDKFFYLFTQYGDGSKFIMNMHAFGDAISLRNDMSFSVCLCSSSVSEHNGYTTVATQLNVNAVFPRSPTKFFSESNGWGWGARLIDIRSKTNTLIFSQFALYVDLNADNLNQPIIQLYGMLMPYSSDVAGSGDVKNHHIIDNQLPYRNPIYGIYQSFAGRVYLHTDDWGQ